MLTAGQICVGWVVTRSVLRFVLYCTQPTLSLRTDSLSTKEETGEEGFLLVVVSLLTVPLAHVVRGEAGEQEAARLMVLKSEIR